MSATCIDQQWLEQHPEFSAALKHELLSLKGDKAHPYRPGSGPIGQSCGTCEKLRETSGSRRKYFKCAVMRAHWTRGPRTDIRKKDAACLAWEPKLEKFEMLDVANRR
jgi:hypothetical protein